MKLTTLERCSSRTTSASLRLRILASDWLKVIHLREILASDWLKVIHLRALQNYLSRRTKLNPQIFDR